MQSWSNLVTVGNAGGNIKAVLVQGDYIYIGGWFTRVRGVPATNIARYNTLTDEWEPLGEGVDSSGVFAIAHDGTDLYVGGNFSNAGGSPASNIAKWNGSAWSTLETG